MELGEEGLPFSALDFLFLLLLLCFRWFFNDFFIWDSVISTFAQFVDEGQGVSACRNKEGVLFINLGRVRELVVIDSVENIFIQQFYVG